MPELSFGVKSISVIALISDSKAQGEFSGRWAIDLSLTSLSDTDKAFMKSNNLFYKLDLSMRIIAGNDENSAIAGYITAPTKARSSPTNIEAALAINELDFIEIKNVFLSGKTPKSISISDISTDQSRFARHFYFDDVNGSSTFFNTIKFVF